MKIYGEGRKKARIYDVIDSRLFYDFVSYLRLLIGKHFWMPSFLYLRRKEEKDTEKIGKNINEKYFYLSFFSEDFNFVNINVDKYTQNKRQRKSKFGGKVNGNSA